MAQVDAEQLGVLEARVWTGEPVDTEPAEQIADDTPSRLVKRPAVFAWVALAVAVVAMSSGGTWFALLTETPPVLKASWRLLLTSMLQVPGFFLQYRHTHVDIRQKWISQLPLMAGTGFVLAVHFDTWSWSINYTSLAHSLLFVSTTPLLLVMLYAGRFAVARTCALWVQPSRRCSTLERAFPQSCLPPSRLEVIGTILGTAAAVMLALAAGRTTSASAGSLDQEPSLLGDLVAMVGALMMGIYLLVGAHLRTWMPLFLYALPVTFASCVSSTVLALALEPDVTWTGVGPASLLGWLGSPQRFGLTAGAALGAGILGHTMCNYSLQHISSLVVSVLLLMEPLVGSCIGWIVGVQSAPDAMTLGAGPLLILGALIVTVGARDSSLNDKFEAWLSACWQRHLGRFASLT
jgi:drug/metabolite transporter (DMT)-like permease